LISGAQGFTGRHLMKLAKARGHFVHALQADVLEPEALQREVARIQPEWVVHLAAISYVGHADADAFYRVNVLGTLNLLDALTMLSTKPQRVLLASSANVYGNCTESPIVEDQRPAPVNHYAASKLAMEHLSLTRLSDLPLFFTRPFNYTGKDQALNFVIPKLMHHFAMRKPVIELGNMAVEREFNDVRFVCDSYLRLLEWGTPGDTYNVCTGRTYTLKMVMSMLSDLTGHVLQVQINPSFVRPNEIHRLCGDDRKLKQCIGKSLNIDLLDTLTWMLSNPS
jgi:nucleoside-diphosphate-sugar epimerase